MLKRSKAIIIAVFLGLVCPTLMMTLLNEGHTEMQQATEESTAISQNKEVSPLQISVLQNDGSIELMNMNDYLTCVVLREMPASFETEALKAQAVVARTYALRRVEFGGKHTGAAVCTDSGCCQGYYDAELYLKDTGNSDAIKRVREAVNLTDNLVLVYNGKLIDATYFSCSGGRTEDAEAVWGTDIPYLRSTQSPGEENAKHFVDSVTFNADRFINELGIKLDKNHDLCIGDITYTPGGGVETIEICAERFTGTDLRKILGLRSTAFAIRVVGDTVTITTKGYGHRVGMSQYGADAMAVSGATFPDILAHYYQGTQLVAYRSN